MTKYGTICEACAYHGIVSKCDKCFPSKFKVLDGVGQEDR